MALWLTNDSQPINIPQRRYSLGLWLVISLAIILVSRLYYLQIIQQPIYRLLAEDNVAAFQIANLAENEQQAKQIMLLRQAVILANENIDLSTVLPYGFDDLARVWQFNWQLNDQHLLDKLDLLMINPMLSLQLINDNNFAKLNQEAVTTLLEQPQMINPVSDSLAINAQPMN